LTVEGAGFELGMSDFEVEIGRAFAFLAEEGFAEPVFEAGECPRARFSSDDLVLELTCWPDDAVIDTEATRRSLGRTVYLDVFHAFHVGEPDYPIAEGIPWPTRASFEETVAEVANIVRTDLPFLRTETETFAEVGREAAS
jgi:hypothetical protein